MFRHIWFVSYSFFKDFAWNSISGFTKLHLFWNSQFFKAPIFRIWIFLLSIIPFLVITSDLVLPRRSIFRHLWLCSLSHSWNRVGYSVRINLTYQVWYRWNYWILLPFWCPVPNYLISPFNLFLLAYCLSWSENRTC